MQYPNKNQKFPLENYTRLCFLKNIITNPNIIVGDYTYYDDFEDVGNFEKKILEEFGIVIQVATPDDSKLSDNSLTLTASGK